MGIILGVDVGSEAHAINKKLCSKCKIEKSVTEFYKKITTYDGFRSCCKLCDKMYCLEFRKKNPDYHKNADKKRCKESRRLYSKKYRETNKEQIKKSLKAYREANKVKIQQYNKQYRRQNRQILTNYHRTLKNNNPLFKLRCNLSRTMSETFNVRHSYGKKTKTANLLGADYETVFNHLQETARVNYGYWLADLDYHIDHIIPCSTANTEEELIALQHYSNLQLLRPADNLAKGNKLDWLSFYQKTRNQGGIE